MSELKLSKLTKKDLKQIFIHNVLGLQLGWNYEKMQGLGYAYSVMPALKRLYKDDPAKMKQALNMEMGFFNTTPQMAHLIVGADVALQDQLGMNDENEKAITGLKTGLMVRLPALAIRFLSRFIMRLSILLRHIWPYRINRLAC